MAYLLPEQKRMENFSEAYVRALAASQGLSVGRDEDDYDSVDLTLSAKGSVMHGGVAGAAASPRVLMQLKCTFEYAVKDGELSYPLPIKNYDDLRQSPTFPPRILVVVVVPRDWTDRLVWSPDELVARRSAVWCSLRGRAPTTNKKSVTVKLCDAVSPDELTRILYLAAEGLL